MGDKTAIEWTDADMLARWFAESVERCAYFKGVDPFHTPLGSYQSWDWPQREMITEIMHDLLRIAFEAPLITPSPPTPSPPTTPTLASLIPASPVAEVAETAAVDPPVSLPPHPAKPLADEAATARAVREIVKSLAKVQGYGGLSWWQIMPRWLETATACLLAQHSLRARDTLLAAMLDGALLADGEKIARARKENRARAKKIARARKWSDLYDRAAAMHEATYMRSIDGLRPEVLKHFTEALGWLALAASRSWDCALSRIYQELALHAGKQHMGQYFTPSHLCRSLARVQTTRFADEGWTAAQPCRVYDPACGAGSMMLAFAGEVSEAAPGAIENGLVSFIMVDLDPVCVLMTKLNATLHGIWHCTNVLEGNSLSREHADELAALHHQMGWDRADAQGGNGE